MEVDWHSLSRFRAVGPVMRKAHAKRFSAGSSAMMFFIFVVPLLVLGCGCGPSPGWKHFNQKIELTKRQHAASEVRTAVLPLFAMYSYGDNRAFPRSELPKELTSLPLFAPEGARGMDVGWVMEDPNSLMFTVGSGFGHWGIVVCRDPDDRKVHEVLGGHLVQWGEGIYFYLQ